MCLIRLLSRQVSKNLNGEWSWWQDEEKYSEILYESQISQDLENEWVNSWIHHSEPWRVIFFKVSALKFPQNEKPEIAYVKIDDNEISEKLGSFQAILRALEFQKLLIIVNRLVVDL
jgi:hypothetical protein